MFCIPSFYSTNIQSTPIRVDEKNAKSKHTSALIFELF